jgi:AraC-like DNA-binding protein
VGFPGADNVLPFCDSGRAAHVAHANLTQAVIRAAIALGVRELIEELGGDGGEIFAAADFDPALLDHPDHYMAPRPLQAVLNIAAERLKRPDFGLLFGERTDLSILGPLYIAMMHARNGREAMELAAHYLHTQTQVISLFIAPLPDGAHDLITLRHASRRRLWLAQNLERNVVVLHRILSEAAGPHYKAVEVRFEHPQLSPLAVYRRIFGADPEFSREHTGIVLERRVLDIARPGRNPQLRQMAEAFLRSLGPPARPSFATRTANMLSILCRASDCTAADTARALGMHERTLQRRLQAEGTTFDQIKDEVRRDLAERYLADPNLPITQIAYMLHYANSSALTRACRRWFAKTPREVRKVLLAGEGRAVA